METTQNMFSNHKTVYVNPSYYSSNFKAEFKIDANNECIKSNSMRLLNLGATLSQPGGQFYNSLTGGINIQSITLYNDEQVITQLLDVPQWLAFKNTLAPNATNLSVGSQMKSNYLGYEVRKRTPNQANFINPSQPVRDITQVEATTSKTSISLHELLPLLAQPTFQYLCTAVFKNLKLVIEFSDFRKFISNIGAGAQTPNNSTQPMLVYEKVEGNVALKQSIASQYLGKNFVWDEIESDSANVNAIVPAGNAGDVGPAESSEQEFKGLHGKLINRILMVKSTSAPESADNRAGRGMGSVCLFKESVQVTVNSVPLFDGGIANSGEKLSEVAQTWGNTNVLMNPALRKDFASMAPALEDVWREMDYFGCVIGDKVDSLRIRHNRHGVVNSVFLNQGFIMRVYAEVRKQMMIGAKGDVVVFDAQMA